MILEDAKISQDIGNTRISTILGRGHQAGLESPKNKPSQAGLAWLVLQKTRLGDP